MFRAPKNSKSAHNLAHPSGKGLQTADNWLELELNSIFVQKNIALLSDNVVQCGSGGGAMRKMMTWEMWKRRLGEILIKFSTKTRKLINDLQKSDCYGLNGEQKKF